MVEILQKMPFLLVRTLKILRGLRKGQKFAEQSTAANPPPKPTHKAQRGGYAAVRPLNKTIRTTNLA